MVYNLTKPINHRVESIKIRCLECSTVSYEPLDYSKTYKIIGNSFLASGGDSYNVFADHFKFEIEGLIDVGVLKNYLKHRSPIYIEEEERIIVHGADNIRERSSNRLKNVDYST